MSSSSGSQDSVDNTHYSDSEEVLASRRRRRQFSPAYRRIKNFGAETTKDFQSVERLSVAHDVIVQDGVMKTPPKVNVTSPETEYVPDFLQKPFEESEDKEIEEPEDKEIEDCPSPTDQVFTGNTRALSKFSSTYELDKFEKNMMIVFNHENVDGYEKRLGTEKDVEALKATFEKFGFEFVERKDRTKLQLIKEVEEFAKSDLTDYGCVAVVILTHGSRQGLLRARDAPYCEIELINHFLHQPLLVTKPIIFIIQACRGTKQTAGVPVHYAGRVRKDIDEEVEAYTLPVEADMLILHSSYIGKPSHRNELYGSWFIQSLCSKINDLADTHDFEAILTEVKREVAIDRYHKEYNRRTLEDDINKQMPVTTSTLIRKLYLKKFTEDTVCASRGKSLRQSSRNEVLDSAGPRSPLVQNESCACFLTHFDYIKDCLRYLKEDNPGDVTAQGFLDVANTFKDDREFNNSKEVTLRSICNHLQLMAESQDNQFYKYLYLYKK